MFSLQDVLKGRAEQLRYKRELAEEQLKLQQADNEMTRMACETNARLAAEMGRAAHEAQLQYQHDLLKQIEYNKILQVSKFYFNFNALLNEFYSGERKRRIRKTISNWNARRRKVHKNDSRIVFK